MIENERKINEQTRESLEIRSAARKWDRFFPDDVIEVEVLTPIIFDAEHSRRGHKALFWIDDFMNQDQEGNIYFIRERTQKFLHHLDIPFRVIDDSDSKLDKFYKDLKGGEKNV